MPSLALTHYARSPGTGRVSVRLGQVRSAAGSANAEPFSLQSRQRHVTNSTAENREKQGYTSYER